MPLETLSDNTVSASLSAELRSLVEAVSQVEGLYVCLIDPEERLVALNSEMAVFWGVHPQEALGQPVLSFLQLGESAPLIRAARAKAPRQATVPYESQDGKSRFFIQALATPIFIRGRYCGVLNIGVPITDQIRAQGFREALFEHPELSIVVVDREGNLMEANARAAQELGLSNPEEGIGRPFASFFPDGHQTVTMAALRDGRVCHSFVSSPLPTGQRDIDAFATPIYDRSGEPLGVLTVTRDATEEVRTRQALNRAWQLNAVGELAAKTTHEFRNCLAAIRCTAQLGELTVRDAESRAIFARIQAQIDETNTLISQLLNLARPSKYEKQPVHLGKLVSQVAHLMSSKGQQYGVTLTTDAPEDLPLVEADPALVSQALINVINNSIDAAPPTGGEVKVKVKAVGHSVHVQVADNGAGIPEQHLSHVFEPFFTTKEHGFGLGLPVVHQIITEFHGGEVTVDCVPGGGTAVRMKFPLPKKR